MASLESLPIELKDQIVSYLSLTDITRLVKTCKSLCMSAQPALFRSITIEFHDTLRDIYHEIVPAAAGVNNLLRTLIERSDLAKQVKSIKISAGVGLRTIDVTLEERKLYKNAIRSLSFPDPGIWETAILKNHPVAVTILLLFCCPRLETLSMTGALNRRGLWLFNSLTHMEYSPARSLMFHRLSTLRLLK